MIAILGPTCSWKSSLGMRLAQLRQPMEVISCDSMQLYRDMDIGTAKPTPEMRRLVPHHLIDRLDIREPCNANRFKQMATALCRSMKGRGVQPLLVGGTGLYAKTFLYDLTMLPADALVFETIEAKLQESGPECLIRELENATAPNAIPRDVRQNPRRLVRACEVLRITGKPPWVHHAEQNAKPPRGIQFCILPTMDVLRERIPKRTRQMLDAGWIEEAERLIGQGLMTTPTARQALGYRQIQQFLEGEIQNRQELEEEIVRVTLRYARRQRTWFQNQHPGSIPIPVNSAQESAESILGRLLPHLAHLSA